MGRHTGANKRVARTRFKFNVSEPWSLMSELTSCRALAAWRDYEMNRLKETWGKHVRVQNTTGISESPTHRLLGIIHRYGNWLRSNFGIMPGPRCPRSHAQNRWLREWSGPSCTCPGQAFSYKGKRLQRVRCRLSRLKGPRAFFPNALGKTVPLRFPWISMAENLVIIVYGLTENSLHLNAHRFNPVYSGRIQRPKRFASFNLPEF
jgi:hypothetical protein